MKKGNLFDLDGTLVESFTTTPLPGVADVLQRLVAHGSRIGIATNQSGPLWRAVTGKTKFPTEDAIAHNLITIAKSLDLTDALWLISLYDPRAATTGADKMNVQEIVSRLQRHLSHQLQSSLSRVIVSDDPNFRKPNPGMLLKAGAEWDLPGEEMCYVGDMATDEEAARNAGIPFIQASELALLLP